MVFQIMLGVTEFGMRINMPTVYVLTQLVHRAHTTDTSLIAVSDSKEKLEKYFETIIEKAKNAHDDDEYLKFFNSTFSIHEVQYI